MHLIVGVPINLTALLKVSAIYFEINQAFHLYILAMATSSFGSGSTDAWIVCFDIHGKKIWNAVMAAGSGFGQHRRRWHTMAVFL